MTQPRKLARAPGRGSIFAAIAVTAFATGPCMLILFTAIDLLFGTGSSFQHDMTVERAPAIVGIVTAGALIGSIPAACLNAYLLNRAARNSMDAIWFSLLCGSLMGLIVLTVLLMKMGWSTPRDPSASLGLFAFFCVTGACMGALHWLIAVRPRRKWRKRLEYDVDAIQAME